MHLSSEHMKPLTCALDHNIGTFSKYPPPHSRPVIILRSLISNYTSWRLDKTMKLYLASIILFLRAGDHNASAQWAHRLNSPCGRDSTSDSVLMCGATPCAPRATIATSTRVTGGGRPRTEVVPSIQSNSLFQVYATKVQTWRLICAWLVKASPIAAALLRLPQIVGQMHKVIPRIGGVGLCLPVIHVSLRRNTLTQTGLVGSIFAHVVAPTKSNLLESFRVTVPYYDMIHQF